MTPTLSERARELGAWLRGRERDLRRRTEHIAYDPSKIDVVRLFTEAAEFKSRAECVEALLAENARLRAANDDAAALINRLFPSGTLTAADHAWANCVINRIVPPSPQGETE